MTLKQRNNFSLLLLVAIVQVTTMAQDFVPVEWNPIVATAATLVNVILLKIGYNSNPDGTTNKIVYEK